MTLSSLRLRLIMGGIAALAVALMLAGWGLQYLFERQFQRSLAETLQSDLRRTLAVIDVDAVGRPILSVEPTDPRFSIPLSGLYWQIGNAKGDVLRSRSLWDSSLPLPADELEPGDMHQHVISGPGSSRLLAVEQTVILEFGSQPHPIRLTFAADLRQVEAARRSFVRDLVPALALLGAALAAAMWVQISVGLSPLAGLKSAIVRIRTGAATRIREPAPEEIAPLVDEINSLLDMQDRQLEKARGRAADLAHGLKTPLAALASDIEMLEHSGEHEMATRIGEVAETMRRHVERELARARLRQPGTLGPPPDVALRPLVETLVSIQNRTPRGRTLEFSLQVDEGATIAMEKADLAEVLGNLLDNAARHARSEIRITVSRSGPVTIEDDGPGVPDTLTAVIVERGKRLDEQGAGLGLAITEEILEAYGRSLRLERSNLGGLSATF